MHTSEHRRTPRLVAAGVATALWASLVLAVSPPAAAHGNLRSASPEPNSTVSRAPATIQMQFGQPTVPDPRTVVEVLLPSGRDIAAGAAAASGQGVSQPLAAVSAIGWYRVRYHVVFVDGHIGSGVFRFRVDTYDKPAPHHPVWVAAVLVVGTGLVVRAFAAALQSRRQDTDQYP